MILIDVSTNQMAQALSLLVFGRQWLSFLPRTLLNPLGPERDFMVTLSRIMLG
jgi:hypothetical protein